MEYFRSTGTSGGLLLTRTQSRFLKETAGDLLRATSLADSAIAKASPEASFRLKALRELVLACVGSVWAREQPQDGELARLQAADLAAAASPQGAVAFDALCSAVLRARFPQETERPPAGQNARWG
jgi:hypothetical protein